MEKGNCKAIQTKVLHFYNTCDDIEKYLNNAANIIVNEAIEYNSRLQHFREKFVYIDEDRDVVFSKIKSENTVEDTKEKGTSCDSNNKNDGEISYGTNNQVDGVDEANIDNATANVIYVGYGEKLDVFDVKTRCVFSKIVLCLKCFQETLLKLEKNIQN